MNQNNDDAALVATLKAAIPNLPSKDYAFARSIWEAQERYGSLSEARRIWARRLIARASDGPQAAYDASREVGDLSGILALFGKARQHLKFPAIELAVPGYDQERAMRVSVAGAKAKEPGSLTVLSSQKFHTGAQYPERSWFGRITLAGKFIAGNILNNEPKYRDAILTRLRAFASDPSKVGGEDGRLAGRCCFCRKALTDERSTAAGYGAKCAQNFGLSWGDKPAEFAGLPAAKEAMPERRSILDLAADLEQGAA